SPAGSPFPSPRLPAAVFRVLAAAIPLKVSLDGLGIHTNYFVIIVVLSLVTIVYTFIGGIKAVVCVDAAQMILYVLGGILAIIIISASIGGGWVTDAFEAGTTNLFVFAGKPIPPTPLLPPILPRRSALRHGLARLGSAHRAEAAVLPVAARSAEAAHRLRRLRVRPVRDLPRRRPGPVGLLRSRAAAGSRPDPR